MDLWDDERTVKDAGYDVPAWIDQDVTMQDVAAIVQGGCASGAYMPAVTYCQARETMAEHGDDIFDALEEAGISPHSIIRRHDWQSWDEWATLIVSAAVELWSSGVQAQAEDA